MCAGVWNFEFVFFSCCMQCVVKALRKVTASVQIHGECGHFVCILQFGFAFYLLRVLKICMNLLKFDEGFCYF